MTAASRIDSKSVIWHKGLALILTFWLSSSLLLDFVVMPSLFAAGMMTQPDFTTAGYGLFWVFNRVELLCAAFVLTGILAQQRSEQKSFASIVLGVILLATSIVCTYFLTPQMSALGLNLNLFEPLQTPVGMNQLHISYWTLEACKFVAAGWLLKREF